jgi:hypothetical protein
MPTQDRHAALKRLIAAAPEMRALLERVVDGRWNMHDLACDARALLARLDATEEITHGD